MSNILLGASLFVKKFFPLRKLIHKILFSANRDLGPIIYYVSTFLDFPPQVRLFSALFSSESKEKHNLSQNATNEST